jgi:hypothetical protein
MATDPKQEYRELVSKYSTQFGVPYHLALAILETESGYRPRAESPKGAKGLFQIMPVISKRYGVTDPFNPDQNVRAGVEHLGVLLRKYDDPSLAIAAYNSGEPAVDRVQGIPNYPETQDYVQKVNAAHTRLSQGQEVGTTMAQEGQFYEQWIYPTARLGSDEMLDGDGVPLPENHPKREGILVSWEGSENDGPRGDDVRQIFQAVDPEGVITREDAADIAAVGTGVGIGTGKFLARRGKDVASLLGRGAVTGGRFVPGVGWILPAAVGVAAGAGQAYSQSQVPKQVGNFDIESWPRSRYGMHYEGAPDTPWEAAHSMLVAAGQEAVGELAGGGIATGVRRLGKWWKGTSVPKDILQGIDRATPGGDIRTLLGGQQGAAKTIAETGTSPTISSKLRAQEAGDAADAAGTQILREAESALGPLTVNPQKVVDDAWRHLDGSVSKFEIQDALTLPGLRRESDKTFKGMVQHFTDPAVTKKVEIPDLAIPTGKYSKAYDLGVMRPGRTEETIISQEVLRGIPLGYANQMRKAANAAAVPLWKQTQRAGQSIAPHEAKVQGAVARALRENIHSTLDNAERSARGGRLQRGVKRIKNLGRGGNTRRFGDRWRNQVDYSRQWYTARNLAEAGAAQPVGGLAAGAAAFSLPGLALSLGRPDVATLAGLATLPQLHPLARSLTGGALYKGGGAIGMAPIQAARTARIGGGLNPQPYQRKPLVNVESFGWSPDRNFPSVRRRR